MQNRPSEHPSLDSDLARLIDAWPGLPAGVRAEILRLAGLPVERE